MIWLNCLPHVQRRLDILNEGARWFLCVHLTCGQCSAHFVAQSRGSKELIAERNVLEGWGML